MKLANSIGAKTLLQEASSVTPNHSHMAHHASQTPIADSLPQRVSQSKPSTPAVSDDALLGKADNGAGETVHEDNLVSEIDTYGVGIDVHSRFIAVCVKVRLQDRVRTHAKDYPTLWQDMLAAKQWILSLLRESILPDATDFH